MKKILSILLVFALTSCAVAQITTPRFGTTKNQDNTGRILTHAIITTTDVTSATIDTLLFTPNAWETIYRPSANLADSAVYKFSSTTTNYRVGDQFTIFVSKGTGAGRIRFAGSKVITSTALSTGVALAANKSLCMRFRWNGSKWIEESRVVEP
jgi:hypothetical protein